MLHFKGNRYIDDFIDLLKDKEEESDEFFSEIALLSLAFEKKEIFYECLVRIKDQNRAV